MEFSYNPVNPFQDDGLSKEDRAMIDGMRNTALVCGYRGSDVEFAVHQALKRIGRTDLLPPCEQETTTNNDLFEIKMVTNIEEAEAYPINDNIIKGFEEFTKKLFKQGQESEK